MQILKGKKNIELVKNDFHNLIKPYEQIAIELGCGDGKFIYKLAKENKNWFCIGIDANQKNLEKYSKKIHRKTEKGGLDNIIYIISRIEQLPNELRNIANYIYIHFPWIGLLKGLLALENMKNTKNTKNEILQSIINLTLSDAIIELLFNYAIQYEPQTMEQLDLPELSLDYCNNILAKQYANWGLEIIEVSILSIEEIKKLKSTWGKKLIANRSRDTYCIRMRKS